MKKLLKILLVPVIALSLSSCNDDISGFDNSLQPSSDDMFINADTFHISTSTIDVDHIVSKRTAETFLLGTYSDDIYGTVEGEILAQFDTPTNVLLPPIIDDSTQLYLFVEYSDLKSLVDSMSINVYQINKLSLDSALSKYFHTNVDPSVYSDKSKILASSKCRIDPVTKSGSMRISLSREICNQFIDKMRTNPSLFDSRAKFIDFFKGIYLTTNTPNVAISVTSLDIRLSYYYIENGLMLAGSENFPSTDEVVKKVNKIYHNPSSYNLSASDTNIYVVSPAGKNGLVKIPLASIRSKFGVNTQNGVLSIGDKKAKVNYASLTFEVADTLQQLDMPSDLMLIRKKSISGDLDSYFQNPVSKIDIVNQIVAKYNSATKSYTFNQNSYLASVLKEEDILTDTLFLVPIDISSTQSVKYNSKFTGVSLRSGNHLTNPLKMSVVITGM